MRCMRRIADCWGEILVGAPAWSRGGLVGPFAAGPPLPRGWCASVGLGEILVGAVAWARWGFGWTLRGGAAAPTYTIPRHSRSPVIPAKAGIHRASWIVAGSVCSLRYRLDPRLREDDGWRESGGLSEAPLGSPRSRG